jgi:hypothetical protein
MSGNETIAALVSIWSEAPRLAGERWLILEPQLQDLLAQFEAASDNEARARVSVQIQQLLEEEAPRLLIHLDDVVEEMEGSENRTTTHRGLPSLGQLMSQIAGLLHQTSVHAYVTRYTDITCPRQVWVETPRISVIVRLRMRPPVHSDAVSELNLAIGVPMHARVEAPDFNILDTQEQETPIKHDADSPPMVFDLQPRHVGHTRINIDFFQAGNLVGTISVPVEITAYDVSAVVAPRSEQILQIDTSVASPDLLLFIRTEHFHGQPALSFELRRAGEVGQTFYPVELKGDPQVYATRLYERLTALTEQVDPTVATVLGKQRVLPSKDAERRVKQLGQNLWRDLIPSDLKAIYSAQREIWQDKTLQIVSDEPHIPWELVWPYESGGWEDDGPWCIQMRMTRWLRRDIQGNGNAAPATLLHFGALACLAPSDSNLPAAQQEQAFFTNLIAQHQLTDRSPAPPSWPNVIALLEAGNYNWLHVAAHGNFYPENPDTDSAIWLEGLRPLTPDAIVGASVEGYIQQYRPAFLFNACHTGRQGWMLTRPGGWANRLISTGAGFFLAPLWTVTDTLALSFAKTFYEELLAGKTVAEAVHQGRLAARRIGDPTWFAYSVYAHPNARIVLPASNSST